MVQKGNSDPFSTSAIVVDSTVSQLLIFYRSCLLPSLHGRAIDVANTPSYATSYWQDSIASLQDECKGCGYLARFAAILASITSDPKMMTTAMVFKQRATELLRSRLAKYGNMQVQSRRGNARVTDLCWSIYSLLAADVAAQNYSAAAVHGRILTKFLQPEDPSLAVTDAKLLHAVLYHDMQRASVSLTRPSFDLNRLALDSLSVRAKLDEITGSREGFVYRRYPTPLDPALKLVNLRNVFTEMRQLLEIAWMMAAYSQLGTNVLIVYLSSWVLICEGRLINHIIDTTLGVTSDPWESLGPQKDSTGHTEACLAALYWLRRASRHEGCGIQLSGTGTPVYNTGPIILQRLRPYLLDHDPVKMTDGSTLGKRLGYKSRTRISPSDQADRSAGASRLRLWISYVAAIAERASRSPKTEYQGYFLQLSRAMRYTSWQDVRESVLKGFLYDESVDPGTPVWFEGAIQDEDWPIL
jgi:hypothetical protein